MQGFSHYLNKVQEILSCQRHSLYLTNAMFIAYHYPGDILDISQMLVFRSSSARGSLLVRNLSLTIPTKIARVRIWPMWRPKSHAYYSVARNTTHRVFFFINRRTVLWKNGIGLHVNCVMYVLTKKIGPVTALVTHHTPILMSCHGTSWV
jgi:hypothetical protein